MEKKNRRAAVPLVITHKILIESGHRCAVCGEGCPLERAHIIPWRDVKEHTAENLVCLCANCHQRADNEHWGEKVLLEYKRHPWVTRRFSQERERDGARTLLEITIDISIDDFGTDYRDLLISALAAFLRGSPADIKVVAVNAGSVKVTLDLLVSDADRLLQAMELKDQDLLAYIAPILVLQIKRAAGIVDFASQGIANISRANRVVLSSEARSTITAMLRSPQFTLFTQLSGTQGRGMNAEDAARSGEITFNALRQKLRRPISDNQEVKTLVNAADEIDVQIELVAIITDLISNLIIGVPPTVVAVLLVRNDLKSLFSSEE